MDVKKRCTFKVLTRILKIYYDNKRNKNIYGITTPKEAQELKEEGIDVASIPWVDNKEN